MGGFESRDASKIVPAYDVYADWRPDDILAAWSRARALRPMMAPLAHVEAFGASGADKGRFNGESGIRLNRREWLEVFTDMERIRDGMGADGLHAGFLSLPLSHFDVLRGYGEERVPVLDVLLAACLCCKAESNSDRARTAFLIFDLDETESIEVEEMATFLHVCIRTLRRNSNAAGVSDIKLDVPPAVIQRVAQASFDEADADGDGFLTPVEFEAWIEKVVLTPKLKEAFSVALAEVKADVIARAGKKGGGKAKSAASGTATTSSTGVAPGSVPFGDTAGTRSLRKGRVRSPSFGDLQDAVASLGGAEKGLMAVFGATTAAPGGAGGDTPSGRGAARGRRRASVSVVKSGKPTLQFDEMAAAFVITRRVQAAAKSKTMMMRQVQTASNSRYSRQEVVRLRNMFLAHAPTSDPSRVNESRLHSLMTKVYPKLADYRDAGRASCSALFRVMDVYQNGAVTFSEWVRALSALTRGSLEDKVDVMFNVLDVEGRGSLSTTALVPLLAHGRTGMFLEMSLFAGRLFDLIGHQHNGILARDDFVMALSKHPGLYDCFVQLILPGIQTCPDTVFRDSRKRSSVLDMDKVAELFSLCEGNDDNVELGGMGVAKFRVFMVDKLGVSSTMLPVINRVHEVLDQDGSGTLSLREVFFGIERMSGATGDADHEKRAMWYFQVYDVDNSGQLDAADILSLLYSRDEHAPELESEVEIVQKMIRRFDNNGDGTISPTEFVKATAKDKRLLEVFGRLFGVGISSQVVKPSKAAKLTAAQVALRVDEAIMAATRIRSRARETVSNARVSIAASKAARATDVADNVASSASGAVRRGRRSSLSGSKAAARDVRDAVGSNMGEINDLNVLHSVALNLQQRAQLAGELTSDAGVIRDPATGAVARRRSSVAASDATAAAASAAAAAAAAPAATTSEAETGNDTPSAPATVLSPTAASGNSASTPTAMGVGASEESAARKEIEAAMQRKAVTIAADRAAMADSTTRRRSISAVDAASAAATAAVERQLVSDAAHAKGSSGTTAAIENEAALLAASSDAARRHAKAVKQRLADDKSSFQKEVKRTNYKVGSLVSEDGTSASAAKQRRENEARIARMADKSSTKRQGKESAEWRLQAALDLSIDFALLREEPDSESGAAGAAVDVPPKVFTAHDDDVAARVFDDSDDEEEEPKAAGAADSSTSPAHTVGHASAVPDSATPMSSAAMSSSADSSRRSLAPTAEELTALGIEADPIKRARMRRRSESDPTGQAEARRLHRLEAEREAQALRDRKGRSGIGGRPASQARRRSKTSQTPQARRPSSGAGRRGSGFTAGTPPIGASPVAGRRSSTTSNAQGRRRSATTYTSLSPPMRGNSDGDASSFPALGSSVSPMSRHMSSSRSPQNNVSITSPGVPGGRSGARSTGNRGMRRRPLAGGR